MPPQPQRRKPATTRGTTTKQESPPEEQPAPPKGDAVRDVLVEAARTQLAAVSAVTTFWAGWADRADTYAKAVSDELAKLDAENGDASELVARISDLTRQYLRDLTELPTLSVQQFNSQLETIGKRTRRRTRAVRVKT